MKWPLLLQCSCRLSYFLFLLCSTWAVALTGYQQQPYTTNSAATRLRLSCSYDSLSSASSSSIDQFQEDEREQEAREIAATTLAPILGPLLQASPSFASAHIKKTNVDSSNPEKTLKKVLRSIQNDGKMRARVAELVLGTFVFRLRHEFVLNVGKTRQEDSAGSSSCNSDDETTRLISRVRSMVDLHASFLLHDNDNCDVESNSRDSNQPNIPWPDDDIYRLSLQYSMPLFLVKAWVEQYGLEESEKLCHVSNRPGPITLRRNQLKCPIDDALSRRLLDEEGIVVVPIMMAGHVLNHTRSSGAIGEVQFSSLPGCLRLTTGRPRSIWGLAPWKDGWFEVQDAGSQLIVDACDAQPGETIVDYCAGNGGKTLAFLSNLGLDEDCGMQKDGSELDRTLVWAHDVVDQRLAQLRGSLNRTGVHPTIQLILTSNSSIDIPSSSADVVLVDAPCSSSGVLRRRPSQRWNLQEQAISQDLPKLQLQILQKASKLVRPGGRLVYATCSLCRWENEDVVAAWESSIAGDQWEPLDFPLAQVGVAPHCRKLLPHVHDSDGFFLARWKRKS